MYKEYFFSTLTFFLVMKRLTNLPNGANLKVHCVYAQNLDLLPEENNDKINNEVIQYVMTFSSPSASKKESNTRVKQIVHCSLNNNYVLDMFWTWWVPPIMHCKVEGKHQNRCSASIIPIKLTAYNLYDILFLWHCHVSSENKCKQCVRHPLTDQYTHPGNKEQIRTKLV